MAQPIIQVEGLSKHYRLGEAAAGHLREAIVAQAKRLGRALTGRKREAAATRDFWALRDVSFSVEEGDVVGVVGRNGAGKSTLLKLLSRITPPTQGHAVIRGRVSSLLEVGTGFHPELTGRENIFLNGALLGMTRAEIRRKFDEIVAFAEVEKFLDTPVKRYSSGMYVRLAFGVAAHLEPEVLIVDEVLAVGDAQFQKKCLGKMKDVARGGRTVLFVSHNMSAVQRLCSRAVMLKQGKLALDASVADVVAAYLSDAGGEASQGDDLLKLPRKNAAGNIRFSRCQVINALGQSASVLDFGEPLRVRLQAVSESDYADLSFVVGVDSVTGVRLFTAVSDDSGRVFHAGAGQTLTVEGAVSPSTVLTPGVYLLSISIRSGRLGLDTLIHVLSFEVSTLAHRGRPPHNGSLGLIEVESGWRTVEDEAPLVAEVNRATNHRSPAQASVSDPFLDAECLESADPAESVAQA